MNSKLVKSVILFVATFFSAGVLYAQEEAVEKEIQDLAKQRVDLFAQYITTIAQKDESLQNRLSYCNRALTLFIGKGGSYTENGVTRKGVVMEVSSTTRKNADGSPYVNRRLMKNYLNGLANLRYAKVVIHHTDIAIFKVSSLKPHPTEENIWTCTVDIEQYFEGYGGDGILLYYDKTVKRITCYVMKDVYDDPKVGGKRTDYRVLLGDVQSLETTKERLN